MENINVLILSAGRRVELMNCFRAAKNRLNISGKLIAGDASDTAPALFFADEKVILPRIDSGKYIEAVIAECIKHSVKLIVPTIDTELLILAENKDRIEKETGAKLLVSDEQVIRICRNKINTQHFMEDNGFLVPHLYSKEEIDAGKVSYPVFVKPVDGSSSINTFRADNEKDLLDVLGIVADPMVQDYMDGEEYTIDVFLDFDSNILSVVPRLRIATRSGEISKGRIVRDEEIIADVRRLIDTLRPIGHITVQCRKTKRGIEYIEINPRFGGGAPMSIMAGADSCEKLYRLLEGEKLEYSDNYRDNIMFIRFDSCIMLNEQMELENEKDSNIRFR